MRVYDWALIFALNGIATFPVRYRDKRPRERKWEQYKKTLPSIDQIAKWFAGGNMHNYGVVMGWNGLAVLDFDDMSAFYEWNLWTLGLDDGHPAQRLAETAFSVKTSRGIHLYYRTDEDGHNRHVHGIDIKRSGYVIGPGSTHPTGAKYEATNALNIPHIETLESILPPEWYEQLQNAPEPEISGSVSIPQLSDNPFDIASSSVFYGQGQSMIEQIKERIPLQSLLSNVTPSSNGYVMAACPFHDDDSPSFWIDTKRKIGNCNKCQFPKPLDIVNVYAKMQGITDAEAVRVLAGVA